MHKLGLKVKTDKVKQRILHKLRILATKQPHMHNFANKRKHIYMYRYIPSKIFEQFANCDEDNEYLKGLQWMPTCQGLPAIQIAIATSESLCHISSYIFHYHYIIGGIF